MTPIPLAQWLATTKRCSQCGYILSQPLPLAHRTFHCPTCHIALPRDWNAALCMEQLSLTTFTPLICSSVSLPTERRKVTPPEMESSTQALATLINQIPFVSAQVLSMNEEAPSFPA
ncbi:MAG: zinc ribbon domain-containing protein [Promethearchaeota archaeon]